MAISFSVDKTPKSKLKRLSFLPRLGITLDFAGRTLNYRQVPIVETVVNVWKKGVRRPKEFMKSILNVSVEQMNEIEMSRVIVDTDSSTRRAGAAVIAAEKSKDKKPAAKKPKKK